MKVLRGIPGVRPAMVYGNEPEFRYVDHTIVVGNRVAVRLDPHQAILLGVLVKAKGRTVAKEIIALNYWPIEADRPRTWEALIRHDVCRLRHLLEPFDISIKVVTEAGYYIDPMIKTDWSNPI